MTEALAAIASEVRECRACPLWRTAKQGVPGEGSSESGILFLGEAPGFNEDQQGRPFVGAAGHLLDELLAGIGLDRSKVFITNVVRHRPPDNRDPLPLEITACDGWTAKQLAALRPRVVVTLGRFAMGKWLPGESISRIHGKPRVVDDAGPQGGKNMLALELGDDILVVDSGLMFPDEEMLGIDLVIPDFRYLRERRSRVRGVLLTHGHEDHVGGLPYLMRDLPDVPIYGTKLTLGLLRTKLKEHRLAERAVLREIAPGTPFQVGNASCDSYTVCHSIPDAVGFTIDTAFGTIVHSGDWKFDHTPVDGRQTDFARLSAIAAKGVLLLLSDSTRAETAGYTPSERHVGEILEGIMSRAPGRVITTTFASNISRIKQIID